MPRLDGADDDGGASVRPPDRKKRAVRTFVEVAPTYGSGLTFWESFGRDLIAAAGVRAGERVLDVACGRGACLWPACEAAGENGFVLGIDLAPAMVELTKRDLDREGIRNAEVRVGDAEHLDLDAASFDVVTCGFAVFFFPAPLVALGECRRVLRVGGRLAASTFADGMLDYPWLPEILERMGLMDTLRNQRGSGPLLRSAALEQALISSGFGQVATRTTKRRFVFADLDAYLLWVRSHAFGKIVTQLNDIDLRHFQHECRQRLQEHQVADGYELIKVVDVTTARRP